MAVVNNGLAVAAWSSTTSTTGGTSATFSTVNGHWYVLCVSADTDNGGTAATLSASWGSGGNGETWTTAKFQQANGFAPAQLIAYVQATASVAGSSVTVTATHITGFVATLSDLTGVDAANPIGANVTDSTTSHLGPTVTPNRTGSLVFAAYGDRNESLTITGNGSTTILGNNTISGETFYTAVSNSNTTAGTAVTVALNSGTATGAVSIGVEVQAPVAAPPAQYAQPGQTWRRAFQHRYQTINQTPPPAVVTVTFPPLSAKPRRTWPPVRRGQSTQPWTFTLQAFPPQSQRPRRVWPPVRRGEATPPWLFTVQQAPPQPQRPRRVWPPVRRGFSSTPPPASVTFTTYPFQQPSPRRKPWLPPVRRGKFVPPAPPSVTFTVYPYPPQGGRPRRVWPPVRRGEATQPQLFLTVPFPPQPPRRPSRFPFRRRGYAAAPTPAQVVFTVYPYPVPSRRRRLWLPLVRRRTNTPTTPPPVTAVPPFTVTATDQAAITITTADGATATVTAMSAPAVNVTSTTN